MPKHSRQPAHLPALLPTASPQLPTGHDHHVPSSTLIAVGTLLAACSACRQGSEHLVGPSFSAGMNS